MMHTIKETPHSNFAQDQRVVSVITEIQDGSHPIADIRPVTGLDKVGLWAHASVIDIPQSQRDHER